MDLSVLHQVHAAEKNYKWKDRLNSLTGNLNCNFLEWSGWYNQDISQRLLGHYRLYQVFKNADQTGNSLSSQLTYLVTYKAFYKIKYLLSAVMSVVYYIFSFGKKYTPFQIEGINRMLVNDKPMILQQFLKEAEENFPFALRNANDRINSKLFFNKDEMSNLTLINQTKNEYNQYQTSAHFFNEYYQEVKNNVKGKEKGVFSKKQLLILFDLLAENKAIERIDYNKQNKFDGIATFFQGVSSKSKDSFVEQLKHVSHNGLYSFKDVGELNQLLITITNLSDNLRKAGFRSLANSAGKKLRELEITKNNLMDD